jgi:F0F1-type ATP synthase assembly protein I
VREHVVQERAREIRIEKVVAVVSTILVLGVSLFAGGCTVIEGALAYAVAGAVMWIIAKRTFYEQ